MVALCICTFNRPGLLDRLLGLIREADFSFAAPEDVCVIVVDNAPDGSIRRICDRHRSALPVALHYCEEPQRGISFARNHAVGEALERGADFVAFIDDDDLPRRDWLRHLVETQRRSGASLVFGFWQMPADAPVAAWLRDINFLKPPNFEANSRYGFPNWAGTFNVLIGRDVLTALAGSGPVFQPAFAFVGGEDVDFFIRAIRLGFPSAKTADSVIIRDWDAGRLTFRGVLRRAYHGGVARVCIDQRHLPKREYARERRKRLLTLLQLLLSLPRLPFLPAGGRRGKAAKALADISRCLGEAGASIGYRYRYY